MVLELKERKLEEGGKQALCYDIAYPLLKYGPHIFPLSLLGKISVSHISGCPSRHQREIV